jgi:hypothetical protein
MKKTGRIVFSLLMASGLSVLSSSAQTHYSSNVSVGVKGGVDLSRVSFTPSVKQGFAMGGNAGVTFRYIEGEKAASPEIKRKRKYHAGWKEDFEEYPFEYSRTLNYVQIPFLAHIYFGRRGRFFFNAGPEIGFMIGESTKANFDYSNISSVPDFPSSLRTTYQYEMAAENKVDFGISAGLGGEFSINKRNSIYIEGRFYYGLGNVLRSGRTENFRGSNSMSVMASIGYWLRVK